MTLGALSATTYHSPAAETSSSITLPATINAGDEIWLFSSEQTTAPTITWPSGFTDAGIAASRTNLHLDCASKTATGSEGGTSVTVTSSATKARTVIAIVWPGTAGTFVGLGSNGASSFNTVGPDTPVAGNNYGVLSVSAQQGAGTPTWTPGSGYTEAAHDASGIASAAPMFVGYLADTGTITTTGTITNVSSVNNNWVTMTLVVVPANSSVQQGRTSLRRLIPTLRRRIAQIFTGAPVLPPPVIRSRTKPPTPVRRTRTVNYIPTTVVVTAQALPPQPGRRRTPLPLRRRRTATKVNPFQVQVTAQLLPPQPGRRKTLLPRTHWRKSTFVVPTQTQVTAQALPPQPRRRRVPLPFVHRRAATFVTPTPITVTTQILPPQPGRRRISPVIRPRTKATQVVQVQTTFIAQYDQPHSRGWSPRPRTRITQIVAAPVIVTIQALPAQQGRRPLVLPKMPRRSATTVPPIQITVTTQPLPPQSGRRLTAPPRPRRSRSTQVISVTTQVIQQYDQPRARVGFIPRRRTKVTQVISTPVILVPQYDQPRRFPIILRRRTAAQFVPPLVIVVPHPIPPQSQARRVFPFWKRSRVTEVFPAQVQDPQTPYIPGVVVVYVDGGVIGYTPGTTVAYDGSLITTYVPGPIVPYTP